MTKRVFTDRCAGKSTLLALALIVVTPVTHAVGVSQEGRQMRDTPSRDWALTTLYGHSFLNSDRSDWNELDFEMLYRPIPELILGLQVDARRREHTDDVLHTASLAYFPIKKLELHWGLTVTPDADFSANQIHNIGLEWRTGSLVSLLFDYERLNYPGGSVDQVKHGITFWFTDDDRTHFTAIQTYGHAFNDRYFDAYNLKMTIGLPQRHSLRFGYYHGKQPENDPAVAGTSLINSDTYSAYYHLPLGQTVDLILGVEHEDLRNIYNRSTATVGVTTRF